jgi:hypothetical protein
MTCYRLVKVIPKIGIQVDNPRANPRGATPPSQQNGEDTARGADAAQRYEESARANQYQPFVDCHP